MNAKETKNFLDWLWQRLNEEPELKESLDKMLYIRRIKMEGDIFVKLIEWDINY